MSRQPALAVSALLILLTAGGPLQEAPGLGWTAAPAYVRLFTPAGVPLGAYEAYITRLDLDAVLRRLDVSPAPPGAWTPEAVAPLDAFGISGRYDRAALARLYGARRVRVARGPRIRDGHVTAVWHLFSPFPDPSLENRRPGTLLIVLTLSAEPPPRPAPAATKRRTIISPCQDAASTYSCSPRPAV